MVDSARGSTASRPRGLRVLGRRRSVVEPPDAAATGAPRTAADLGTACVAPLGALYFMTNGDVQACCMNASHPLGNVASTRLGDIWAGTMRRQLVDAMAAGDFSLGCQVCSWQDAQETDTASYSERYDIFADAVAALAPEQWPVHLEFNLSNSCNLQCIQCNGELSSSIRIHREGLPPLPRVYDDQFFADLVPFLRHAVDIQVAGGEPFLGRESFQLWDHILEHAPQATCNVVTNGSQWNTRVERILDTMAMSVTISIDGITKDVYESIRVGADFDLVLENIDRFHAYTRRAGTHFQFNHCLMVQNHHEFADLLLFAEERAIPVNVSVVYQPSECSLGDLDAEALGRVCDALEARSAEVLPQLTLNAATWTRELERLRQWQQFRESSASSVSVSGLQAESRRTLMGMRRLGRHRIDEGAGRAILEEMAPGQTVHTLTVAGADEITACSEGAAEALGIGTDGILGRTVGDLHAHLSGRLGPMGEVEVVHADDDIVAQVMAYGPFEFRGVNVAIRDDNGWADEVRILFVEPTPVRS